MVFKPLINFPPVKPPLLANLDSWEFALKTRPLISFLSSLNSTEPKFCDLKFSLSVTSLQPVGSCEQSPQNPEFSFLQVPWIRKLGYRCSYSEKPRNYINAIGFTSNTLNSLTVLSLRTTYLYIYQRTCSLVSNTLYKVFSLKSLSSFIHRASPVVFAYVPLITKNQLISHTSPSQSYKSRC